jgi:hypothetical protein
MPSHTNYEQVDYKESTQNAKCLLKKYICHLESPAF